MIKNLLCGFALIALAVSCNTAAPKQPVTDTEVATAFIRAVLDNDFTTAEKYLLKDDTNQQYFATFKHQYQSQNEAELAKYKAADIVINEIKSESDSVHFVDYSNTYKRESKNNLKLKWVNGQWLIDLKYTLEPKQ